MPLSATTAPARSREPDAIEELCINTVRTLSMDAVQKANSGHPGTPMALAPAMVTLWQRFLRYAPERPLWPNRDRFVLSNGHASMLLYSMLHLCGVRAAPEERDERPGEYEQGTGLAVTLDDIRNFRQWGSKCPGHPEYRLVTGVETTTGPLGQGVATSVGMAMASRWLGARYGESLYNYRVFVFCGDGDLMEGVSGEAASIAGHLGLGRLCWIYDNNQITIEGRTELAFDEDVRKRFEGYGWDVDHVKDANDTAAIRAALSRFEESSQAPSAAARPRLIILNSHIGYGAPHRQDTKEAHGEALGEEEVRLAKKFYGWPEEAHFLVPDGVKEYLAEGIGARGARLEGEWRAGLEEFKKRAPELALELETRRKGELPPGWDRDFPKFPADAKGIATRDASGKVENVIASRVPWLIGGAADLAPSTKTLIKDGGDFERGNPSGRNLHFGIREHAMGAILNGLALSGVRPFGATFLIFSDYERPAIRLSALMELPVIQIFTHDSIGLGEDGPTHQPIEQLASLRAMPGLEVVRPCDANETAEAWKHIMKAKRNPIALVLTRQAVPTLDRTRYASAEGLHRGGYVLADPPGARAILMATGSEVSLAIEAYERLLREGIPTRVVSLPCWELFERQDESYRRRVLPPEIRARVAIEQASCFGWERYLGDQGVCIGMTRFGASAPLKDLLKHFGFTPENIIHAVRGLLK